MIKRDYRDVIRARYRLLVRGYCHASDIARFVPCSRDMSYKIIREIRAKSKLEGLESLNNVVLTKRVMEYIGITESKIRKEYESIDWEKYDSCCYEEEKYQME